MTTTHPHNTATLAVRVNGIPAPQGSKRHVGNGRMVESSKAVGPWREAVRAETQRQHQGAPLDGPLWVHLAFMLPRPRGHFGVRGLRPSAPRYPDRKPDLDKLVRAVLDALVAGGGIRDDARVVRLHADKTYADDVVAVGVAVLAGVL